MNIKIKRKYIAIVVYNRKELPLLVMWSQLIAIKNSLRVHHDVEFQFTTRTPLIGKKNRMKVTNNRQKNQKTISIRPSPKSELYIAF